MNGLAICTLVIEYNYTESRLPVGSVWLRCGNGTRDLELEASLEALPGWHKIVGPINYEDAYHIHSSLKTFLDECGVQVIDEGIAD